MKPPIAKGQQNLDSVLTSHVDDCEIDDMDLMDSKKHLTLKGPPLTVMESLKSKHKTLNFEEITEKHRDLKTNKDIFTITWQLKGYDI